MGSRKARDFIDLAEHDGSYLLHLLDLARRLKMGRITGRPLEGRCLAMIFRKSSTRTRVSTEVGMAQLGGHALMIADRDSQMGRGESVRDTARVLSRYVDAILIRTFGHDEVVELARDASVPVINGLTDLLHPCQVMADLLTAIEEFGDDVGGLRVAWIGDGNNMAHSWLNAASRLGFTLRLACPPGYGPDPQILARARAAGDVEMVDTPADAAAGARVVTTDVWASMGQEDEQAAREVAFAGYCVDEALMARAHPSGIFLHCLPAHRGEEVTAAVIDGKRSRVYREAENRLHVIKAILLDLIP
jgi:ornithine carbamoyltransferase